MTVHTNARPIRDMRTPKMIIGINSSSFLGDMDMFAVMTRRALGVGKVIGYWIHSSLGGRRY